LRFPFCSANTVLELTSTRSFLPSLTTFYQPNSTSKGTTNMSPRRSTSRSTNIPTHRMETREGTRIRLAVEAALAAAEAANNARRKAANDTISPITASFAGSPPPRSLSPPPSTGRTPSENAISSGYDGTPAGFPRTRLPSTPPSTGRTPPGYAISSGFPLPLHLAQRHHHTPRLRVRHTRSLRSSPQYTLLPARLSVDHLLLYHRTSGPPPRLPPHPPLHRTIQQRLTLIFPSQFPTAVASRTRRPSRYWGNGATSPASTKAAQSPANSTSTAASPVSAMPPPLPFLPSYG
jgi:hypothetical protein